MSKRLALGNVAVGVIAVLAATAAAAEGSWTSSMTGVVTGFHSRTWTDKNSDSSATKITLTRCTGWTRDVKANPTLKLIRERPGILPNENRGGKKYTCSDGRGGTLSVKQIKTTY